MSSPVALLAISDPSLRQKIGYALKGLRWQVLEMSGGAETLYHLEAAAMRSSLSDQAVILDKSLPDLDLSEFLTDVQSSYPDVDLISIDGSLRSQRGDCPGRRGELMHAIRKVLDSSSTDESSEQDNGLGAGRLDRMVKAQSVTISPVEIPQFGLLEHSKVIAISNSAAKVQAASGASSSESHLTKPLIETSSLPDLIGTHPVIDEVRRRIRLVAARMTPVLIQGPTGTGKELVALAIHRLSPRAGRPFIVLNCAAIPESLLEAEVFGHARGAFTGAVQRRIGRIESANGGTLFLDEIGELPLNLQAKLLRFLEAGEIQRIGENEPHVVNVRVIAATNQHLALRSRQGSFREDLFHRLAVFTIQTPSLMQHPEDIPQLAKHFLQQTCEGGIDKYFDESAMNLLAKYQWPGNVRELTHVVERANILSENRHDISESDIEFDSYE